ncbi:MAG: adenine methyltransferase [Bacteroidetes bacterium]|nr:adenine methyltransferase [Bacteroidota bacterium]
MKNWMIPPYVLNSLGEFDIDPCTPKIRPFDTAKTHYNYKDGLTQPWVGRVICTPPYEWVERCAEHRNSIVLMYANLDTKLFTDIIWPKATALLFLKGRLRYYNTKGERGGNSLAPSVLVAFDDENAIKLRDSGLEGMFISIN